VAAVKSGMKQDVLKVLGADGEDIVDSGDDVADADARNEIPVCLRCQAFAQGRRQEGLADHRSGRFFHSRFRSSITGTAGNSIPRTAGGRFSTGASGAMNSTRSRLVFAFVDAEHEYAKKDRGDGVGTYAQKIVSGPGKKDGLYWPSDSNDSPLGELAAEASAEGYKASGEPRPYHGLLTIAS